MRAAIYLRISRDDEMNGLAIERQREDCLRVVTQRNWTLHETYVDQGISASKREVHRPAYERMLRDYQRGAFDAIVCYDLDRLTRQPRQLEDWIDAAESRGLALVTATGEADLTTDNGRLFARIKASVARAEVERKGARQRRANDQRAASGLPYAGNRTYGYDTDAVTQRPDEVAIIRRIFAETERGTSFRQIARTLNAEGVPAAMRRNGRPWDAQTVRRVVANRRYGGEVLHRGEWIPGTLPPIVDPELAARVQALQADPARVVGPGPTPRWLLSGTATCGACHARLLHSAAGAGTYICTARATDRTRQHIAMRDVTADAAAIRGLADVLVDDGPALLATTPAADTVSATLAALGRNEAAAVATVSDRDDGLLSAAAARARLLTLRDERTHLEQTLAKSRLEQSSAARLIALAQTPARVGIDPMRDAIEAAARIEDAFKQLPIDEQRAVMRAAVYVTILPTRRGAHTESWRRVRVASRLQVEFAY